MGTPKISFEFFPPQTLEASFRLWDTVRVLSPMQPEFVSVTYGAGGTTRKLTHEAVTTIGRNYGLDVAAHLTCVNATRAQTMEIVENYAQAGVTELVALRGDAPKGAERFTAHPEGFASSVDLIEALARDGRFKIRCGAYPEPHPDSADTLADVRWLKRKCDAGATSSITQFFFEAETFFRFRDLCEKEGVRAKIIPGILPIQGWKGAKRFAQSCGTSIPTWVEEAFASEAAQQNEAPLAHDLCTKLCADLLDGGVEDLHFYTLNRPTLTGKVCQSLGIAPDLGLDKVA
ncbi:methylenetetrahydrofolate reductase [NAD(P)H] [Rhodobacteraceae bacterium]|nr:methylenetetrahydrofolate reductase [NAD(P)H] [Paracoccaceae bacterium]